MSVTSPPYYSPGEGLRNYRVDPVTKLQYFDEKVIWSDRWDGDLGMEPTPQMYITHLLEICAEVLRVLRPEGTFWLNLGDSRAGSGRGPSGKTGAIKNQEIRQGFVGTQIKIPEGFKRKDVFGIPFRVGIALQEQGWYWRDTIPWLKHNGMPGSYKDRPVSNLEWVLLLTKTANNYYDYVAVMQQASESYLKIKTKGVLRQRVNPNTKYNREEGQFKKQDYTGNSTYTNFNQRYKEAGSCDKRLLRSSDFFFKTWQGLWLNEENEPVAMIVNPKSYLGKHYAGYPVMLPQICITASTSEKGVCPECGAQWERITKKGEAKSLGHSPSTKPQEIIKQFRGEKSVESSGFTTNQTYEILTTGWQPTCKCGREDTVPATVLDFFAGTSSTGVACKKINRNYIGIELNPVYCKLGETRIKEEGADQPVSVVSTSQKTLDRI
jgi:DNA modification methylase